MGGSAPLASHGFTGRPKELGRIKQMIGRDHVAMLRRASRYIELERHVMVHAALEPGMAPADQRPERMIFSDLSFVTYKDSSGKTRPRRRRFTVRHGRILPQPDRHQHRGAPEAHPVSASH